MAGLPCFLAEKINTELDTIVGQRPKIGDPPQAPIRHQAVLMGATRQQEALWLWPRGRAIRLENSHTLHHPAGRSTSTMSQRCQHVAFE